MSKDLPLWNADETDVLPEHQYTFGHVLVAGVADSNTERSLWKTLGVRPIGCYDSIVDSAIPKEPASGVPVLSVNDHLWFIFAYDGTHTCIFGAHDLFFSAKRWIEWNRRTGGDMAYVTQIDLDEYSYRVFSQGRHKEGWYLRGGRLTKQKEVGVDVYVAGSLASRYRPKVDKSGIDYEPFIRHDMEMTCSADGVVTVERRFREPLCREECVQVRCYTCTR